ncbi:MAG: ABC transporter permease [Chloroflexi bacterium]|nr:ABC transporter permease [Chloroflexota bacterium]
MWQYITRRLVFTIPVLLFVTLAIFLMVNVLPGDIAFSLLVGQGGEGSVSAESLAALRHRLGTDRPLAEQYLSWVAGVLRLDPGTSLQTGRPITQEIGQRIVVTIELALLTVVISWIIAIPVGVLSALRQDTWADYVLRVASITGMAMPTFWTGILVLLALVVFFRWFPPLGFALPWHEPWENLQQIVWPALALGFFLSAVTVRMTRSCLLEVLRQDYIRTARSKGLRDRVVMSRHALRNAMLPVVTITGVQLGHLLGGTVVMETVFNLPGLGTRLVEGILVRDYPVVQSLVLIMACWFAVINLLVDIAYAWLDPRVRYS